MFFKCLSVSGRPLQSTNRVFQTRFKNSVHDALQNFLDTLFLFATSTERCATIKKEEPEIRATSYELFIPAKQFIKQHIKAVWHLELLLLLRNQHQSLNADEAALLLHMEPGSVNECLQAFASQGILVVHPDATYEYEPSTQSLSDSVDDTAKMFNERKTSVINLIYMNRAPESD